MEQQIEELGDYFQSWGREDIGIGECRRDGEKEANASLCRENRSSWVWNEKGKRLTQQPSTFLAIYSFGYSCGTSKHRYQESSWLRGKSYPRNINWLPNDAHNIKAMQVNGMSETATNAF